MCVCVCVCVCIGESGRLEKGLNRLKPESYVVILTLEKERNDLNTTQLYYKPIYLMMH